MNEVTVNNSTTVHTSSKTAFAFSNEKLTKISVCKSFFFGQRGTPFNYTYAKVFTLKWFHLQHRQQKTVFLVIAYLPKPFASSITQSSSRPARQSVGSTIKLFYAPKTFHRS